MTRQNTDDPVAVIADVHGNRWALEAVIEDIERRGIRRVLNLGDSLYGPLDPAGTAELFRRVDAVSICGNQDRILLSSAEPATKSPTFRFVVEQLAPHHIEWLSGHAVAPIHVDSLFLCHGTPQDDDRYLIEQITRYGVVLKEPERLRRELDAIAADVILCGHSHVPQVVTLPDSKRVVNPGSVGLPAYTDDAPYPHAMEAGSPHARYAWLERAGPSWRIEHIALPYDWERAAAAAEQHDRLDWARWLRTGRATV